MSTHDDFRTDEQMEKIREYWETGDGSKKPTFSETEKEKRTAHDIVDALREMGNPYAKEELEETYAEPEIVASGTSTRRITAPKPPALTGSMGSSAATHVGGHGFTGGGMVTTPGFAPSVYPGTSTPPWVGSPPTTTTGTLFPDLPKKAKSKKNQHVRLPPRFTDKVLLGFVDEDDEDDTTNVIWAAHLRPEDIEINRDADGRMSLTITLSLEDDYDNNPED